MYFVRIIGHVEEMHAHIRITWKRLMFMLMGEKRISLHVLTDMNTTVKKPVSVMMTANQCFGSVTFYADPDPRIRFRDDGSGTGSGSGSGSDLKSNKF